MSGAYNLQVFVEYLESWGLTDVLLPFLLIFTLIFGILHKTEIFGPGKKNFNIVIALVMSLTVVIPHVTGSYPGGYDVVDLLNSALPQVSVVVVMIVMMLLLVGLFGGKAAWVTSTLAGWIAILALGIVVFIFGGAAGWWEGWNWTTDFLGTDAVAVIIMLLVFGMIIWYVTKPDSKEATSIKGGRFVEEISKLFGGGK